VFDITQADSRREWVDNRPVDLVWTDPPFGTGKLQSQGGLSYQDYEVKQAIDAVVRAIDLIPKSSKCVLAVLMDYRAVHHVCVELADRYEFLGEIVWSFGLGRPRQSWWPVKHNTILTFAAGPDARFDPSANPRVERLAPKPGYPSDKSAGSVWDKTLSNTDPERVGFPNQKPLAIIEPFIEAHTEIGDLVADPFCGSGSVGHAAISLGRNFVGQDLFIEAVRTTRQRLSEVDGSI